MRLKTGPKHALGIATLLVATLLGAPAALGDGGGGGGGGGSGMCHAATVASAAWCPGYGSCKASPTGGMAIPMTDCTGCGIMATFTIRCTQQNGTQTDYGSYTTTLTTACESSKSYPVPCPDGSSGGASLVLVCGDC